MLLSYLDSRTSNRRADFTILLKSLVGRLTHSTSSLARSAISIKCIIVLSFFIAFKIAVTSLKNAVSLDFISS